MVDLSKIENYTTIGACEGKTIDEVHDGYEDIKILFEDGSCVTINTFSGNSRDI